MSRYYNIVVGAETATPVGASAASNNAGATWTNLVNGQVDLGAQTVEFDIHLYEFDAPVSQAYIKIWGPSKQQISQASDFNGAPIKVYGGMQNGLPLATAAASNGQAGLLLSGQIFQAFGNWQGINQTLDFVVTTDGGATQSQPANLSFLWLKGQQLSQVIEQTLQLAYPKLQVSVNISSSLVLTQTEAGVYQTLQQFASYVNGVSQNIIGGDYSGVKMTLANGVINVYDSSGTLFVTPPKQILAQDMMGQATWLDVATVQFNTVMRADLAVGSQIMFPPLAGITAVTTPQSGSNARTQNTFSGSWKISYMRHVGNSRAPDAQSWISTFQAVTNTSPPASLSVANSSS